MSNIKAGDLVMVIKPKPCGCTNALGAIYRVEKIEPALPVSQCKRCRKVFPTVGNQFCVGYLGGQSDVHLKVIDPPSTEDQITMEVEVTA